eukprot:14466007-Heterocapsa_arctica.AAC.1
MFGAPSTKPTEFKGTLAMAGMAIRCDHPKRWWAVPWSGESYFAAHAQLRGKQRAIPCELWDASMLSRWEPDGPYLTRSSAAYPDKLNMKLADCF